jgi:hypothetical protein
VFRRVSRFDLMTSLTLEAAWPGHSACVFEASARDGWYSDAIKTICDRLRMRGAWVQY